MSKNFKLQVNILFVLILANFIAQIPYTIHLYGVNRLATISPGIIAMYVVFVLFLVGYFLFRQRKRIGYWLLVTFLAMEFLFYLWNFIGSLMHGFPLFFQLFNPDLLLRTVFAIGYINLFASGYFLFLLLYKKSALLKR